MSLHTPHALHAVDILRKKRDAEELTADEIRFIVEGAARETIPEEQLSAWLMAVFLRGLTLAELDTLTTAMRFSGDVLRHDGLGHPTVDKHSTGGVGDKTSFLVAPIAAAAGLADPMISGRALGHTGGTLDKLESIPGYRTQLSLEEMRRVLDQLRLLHRRPDQKPRPRRPQALRPARPHRHRRKSLPHLRLHHEQEARRRPRRPRPRRQSRLRRLPPRRV